MIQKIKKIPGLLSRPLRATAFDFASLSVPEEVKEALNQPIPSSLPKCPAAADVDKIMALSAPDSRSMFTGADGFPYPSWLEGDENLGDDWLLAPDYYPHYFRLYQALGEPFQEVRMLEFGVRSGYSALVLARALPRKRLFYVGVDPNLYVEDGLAKAAQSYRQLRMEGVPFDFFLLEGFSGSNAVQHSLQHSGPYQFIHIDGEHTLFGKVFDLWIARNLMAKNGYVLVDDYEHHGFIADSVNIALHKGWFSRFSYLPTKRGLAILS